jgi:hypothetical protein
MPKTCLSCGTHNPINAKYCCNCRKPFASGGSPNTSIPPVRKENIVYCTKCRKQVRVLGNYTKFCEPRSPVKLYREEWEFLALECKHDIPIRRTGKEDDDITGL